MRLAARVLFTIAGTTLAAQQVVPLWPGAAPGSESWTQKELEYRSRGELMVRNITTPSFTVFLPDKATANGAGIVVAPGGAFRFLSWENEGTKVAEWLNAHGVAAFVLKYRVVETAVDPAEFQNQMTSFLRRAAGGPGPSASVTEIRPMAVADGKQAIHIIRKRAAEWGVMPDRIGLMGFSAGAMLTTGVLTDYDADSRPNFAAPIYGVSVDPSKVPQDAPPIFIACAEDDPLLPSTNSSDLFAVWKKSNHMAELHIFAKGGHGFGMHHQGLPVDHWIERFGEWLDMQGLLKPAKAHVTDQ